MHRLSGTHRRFPGIGVLVAAALLPAALGAQAPNPSPPSAPKLLVLLVVDQFRTDYIDTFGQHWKGGLRRLLTDGAWFRESAYPYFTTVTCAGHATVVTGSLPATHGIISNSWWDRRTGQTVMCVADPAEKSFSYGAKTAAGGTSARNLRVPALPDEMRARMTVPPRVVSISLKDYSATTMAGSTADAVVWFNAGAGAWMTTTAFTKTTVPFISDFLKKRRVEDDYGKTWSKALPQSAYLYTDEAVGEDTGTWGPTFPHVLKGNGNRRDAAFYLQWHASPFADAFIAEMAAHSVDALKLGQGAGTDYLAVSFSVLDIVGHDFGPGSHEVQDVLARLDETLGRFFAHLDKAVGKDNYVVALTSDHGVAPIPEQITAQGVPAGRLMLQDVTSAANNALQQAMGAGAPQVARIVYSDLYFAPGDWQKVAEKPEAVRALVEAIRAVPGIADVFRGDELESIRGTATDRVRRAAALSYFPGRSGDLILVPQPNWLFSSTPVTKTGTTHGSPYDYDQRVPVIIMGRGIKPGHYTGAAGPQDIAPTLAFLCGITLPAADGRVMSEALATAAVSPDRVK